MTWAAAYKSMPRWEFAATAFTATWTGAPAGARFGWAEWTARPCACRAAGRFLSTAWAAPGAAIRRGGGKYCKKAAGPPPARAGWGKSQLSVRARRGGGGRGERRKRG